MQRAWCWFNKIATWIGVASLIVQAALWVWMSAQEGRPATYIEVHHQFDQRIEQLLERLP